MDTTQVVKGRVEIKLSDGKTTLVVKEMSFIDTKELCKRLGKYATQIMERVKVKVKIENPDKDGVVEKEVEELRFDFSKIPDLILGADDLSAFVLEKSTDLKPEELAALPLRDALEILDNALDQTLNEEVLSRGKALGSRLQNLMSDKKTASAKSATS